MHVDGVSITHGASPRKHIWTYAAAHDGNQVHSSTCPCTGSGPSPPDFVGSDYYCESGVNTGSCMGLCSLYPSDPLWDGQGCDGLERTCCDRLECTCCDHFPWYCKKLLQSTTDYLEFHICGDQAPSNEDTPLTLLNSIFSEQIGIISTHTK